MRQRTTPNRRRSHKKLPGNARENSLGFHQKVIPEGLRLKEDAKPDSQPGSCCPTGIESCVTNLENRLSR